jgi:hypothetical protein
MVGSVTGIRYLAGYRSALVALKGLDVPSGPLGGREVGKIPGMILHYSRLSPVH